MHGPRPTDPHPMAGFPQVCFIRNTVKNPNIVVGGNPAKILKSRFPPETIDALEQIAWWNWPVEKITRHLKAIVSADLAALQAAAHDPKS